MIQSKLISYKSYREVFIKVLFTSVGAFRMIQSNKHLLCIVAVLRYVYAKL